MQNKYHKIHLVLSAMISLLLMFLSTLAIAQNTSEVASAQEAEDEQERDDNNGLVSDNSPADYQSWLNNNIDIFFKDASNGLYKIGVNFYNIPTNVNNNIAKTTSEINNSPIVSAIRNVFGSPSSSTSNSSLSSSPTAKVSPPTVIEHQQPTIIVNQDRNSTKTSPPNAEVSSPTAIEHQQPITIANQDGNSTKISPPIAEVSPPKVAEHQPPIIPVNKYENSTKSAPQDAEVSPPKVEEYQPPITIVNQDGDFIKISTANFEKLVIKRSVNSSRNALEDQSKLRNINLKLNALYMSNDALSR